MFLFGKKKKEDRLRQQLAQITGLITAGERVRHESEASAAVRMDELGRTLDTLRESVNRHDLAVADLLDSLEEWRQRQEEVTASLRDALDGESRRAAAESRQEMLRSQKREDTLAALVSACFDQFHMLRRSAEEAGDPYWTRQAELAEEKLSADRLTADFHVAGIRGEMVNYDIHEIAAAVDTEDPNLAMRVADVYTPGYIYRGRVLRKAVVSAYRAPQRRESTELTGENGSVEAYTAAVPRETNFMGGNQRERDNWN